MKKSDNYLENYRLSHTTIYRRVACDKHRGGQLYRDLPRFGKTRWKEGKRNRNAGAQLIPGRIDISERPSVVEKRNRLGDWEGDTVHPSSTLPILISSVCDHRSIR